MTLTTYEKNIEPRYVVVIRGAITAMLLVASAADAAEIAKPYEGRSDTVAEVMILPLNDAQQQDASDVLESFNREITEAAFHSVLRPTLSIRGTIDASDDWPKGCASP